MTTTRVSKKRLTSVHSNAKRSVGKDPILKMIGLLEARPSDVTKNHNKILYG